MSGFPSAPRAEAEAEEHHQQRESCSVNSPVAAWMSGIVLSDILHAHSATLRL